MSDPWTRRLGRGLLQALGILLFLPAATFLAFVLTGPGTWSGVGYALGLFAVVAAAFVRRAWSKKLALFGAAAIAVVALVRVGVASRGEDLVMNTGPRPGSRVANRLLDEEDLAVSASRVIRQVAFMRDPDIAVLPEEMSSGYARMREEQGDVPSPVVATYLGLQSSRAYDDVEIGDVEHASGVLVFLHGWAGSFTLPCWEVSQAAKRVGMATVCPATRWVGDWWSPAGEATLRAVVDDLHARGQKHLVLAGLSNGGIGGSLLLPRFAGTFEGFIAISGASPAAPAPGIPVLAVQGAHDVQIPASVVHAYATRSNGRYVELDAGHFALLLKESQAVDAMAAWLAQRPFAPHALAHR